MCPLFLYGIFLFKKLRASSPAGTVAPRLGSCALLNNNTPPTALHRFGWSLLIQVPGIVVALVILPEHWRPDPKVFTNRRLVPKHTVRNLVRFGRIIQYETFVVLCARIHHLAKHIKVWENTKEGFVEALPVLPNVVSEREHVVDISSNHRRHVHDVLGRHHEENLPMPAVHKKLANACITHKGPVVHAVVHEYKDRAGSPGADELLLTLDEFLESPDGVVRINEYIRNKLFVPTVPILSA